jgi:predicted permease
MGSIWQDIRYGARVLLKAPGFTLIAVLALALGIGANTAIFSVIYGLIFRPLPGAQKPSELVSVTLGEGEGWPHKLSYVSYQDYCQLKDIFSGCTATTENFAQISADAGSPERIFASAVMGNYFEMLGVKAELGRTFNADESERMGAGNVLVLNHEFWQRRFGGAPSVVGSTVRIDGHPFTVIGVLPAEFKGTSGFLTTNVYLPHSGIDYIAPGTSKTLDKRVRSGGYTVIARLRLGVTLAQARAAVAAHGARLASEYPETQRGQRGLVYPEPMGRMEPSAIGYMPPVAAVFMSMVVLVLLIACANVANLMLARAMGRQKEIAIRVAVGAGRLRILRQLLVESLMLSFLGAGLGWFFARWTTGLLASTRPATDMPLTLDFHADERVFYFTLLVAVATGIVSGLVPALQATRTDLATTLKEGGRRSSGGSSRHVFRNILVVAQVAVCLALLISAGLFVRTTRNVGHADMGFEMNNRLLVAMDTDLRQYDEAKGRAFYKALLERVRGLPGVLSASTGTYLPIGFGNGGSEIFIEGAAAEKDTAPEGANNNIVGTDYFQTMGMPMLYGRSFNEQDKEGAPLRAIINEAMMKKYWPGQNPVGKRFSKSSATGPFLEIVGVTRTVKFSLPAEAPSPGYYLPFEQNFRSDEVLHIHTAGDPLQLASSVRREIQALDGDMPIWDVRSMEEHVRKGKLILFDIATGLMGTFGLIGMTLAAIGLYGVMAYSVGQRSHEIGVRMALGASRGRILGMVMRQGMVLALIGIALGLIGAFGLTRSFANLLVGITPTDPVTFTAVALFLIGVALVASSIPALRATRVDPMVALRSE